MKLLFLNIGTPEIIILLGIVFFYIYCLIHIMMNSTLSLQHRILWFLIILCVPLLGSIAYLVMGRKQGQGAAV